MSNMSYCRFQNTLPDFRDCIEHWYDGDLSDEEKRARKRMKKLILELAYELEDEDEEE